MRSQINVEQEVEKSVKSFVSKGKQFTAFDVTEDIRSRYPRTTAVFHGEVKLEVHRLFDVGDPIIQNWDRTLINIEGFQQKPYLYHPKGQTAVSPTGPDLKKLLADVLDAGQKALDGLVVTMSGAKR